MKERKQRMLDSVKGLVVEYWSDGIQDDETIINAASELLMEQFNVNQNVAERMARKYVNDVWSEAVAQADYETEDAIDSEREYYEARMGAY